MKTTHFHSSLSIKAISVCIVIYLMTVASNATLAQLHSDGIISELSIDDSGNLKCKMVDPEQSSIDLFNLKRSVGNLQENSTARVSKKIPGGAEIIVNYVGFTHVAQAAFQYAVDIWAGLLTSEVPIQIYAEFTPLQPGQLGGAGPYWIVGNTPGVQRNTWYPIALADKLANENIIVDKENDPDIFAQFNSNYANLYFGTDGNTPDGKYDFVTIVLHELCHGLGFFGLMNYSNGIGYYGASGYLLPAIFDHYTYTRMGRSLTNENFFPNPSIELGDALTGDQILFSGSNVIKITKGKRALLYTLPNWIEGSSYVHLDEFEYPKGSENALMTPLLASGESILHPGSITLSIFNDIGWNGKVKVPYKENAAPNSAAAGGKYSVTIFPNPVESYFSVEIDKQKDDLATVKLFNEFGVVYNLGQWSFSEKSYLVDLSSMTLQPGMYFLYIEPTKEAPLTLAIYKE